MRRRCPKCGNWKGCGFGCNDRPGHVHCACGVLMSPEREKRREAWSAK